MQGLQILFMTETEKLEPKGWASKEEGFGVIGEQLIPSQWEPKKIQKSSFS